MMSILRAMAAKDKPEILNMMRQFYSSPAVYTSGSDEIFSADIEACLSDSPYIEGYILESNGETAGYAMVAKSFSTEFGKQCIWIEDLYIKEEYRGRGMGDAFMKFITDKYKNCIFRLEVEEENENAVALYKKHGFENLPYAEMKK